MGQAKPRLWPGFGPRPGLKILQAEAPAGQAKAGAFKPSWAGTTLAKIPLVFPFLYSLQHSIKGLFLY